MASIRTLSAFVAALLCSVSEAAVTGEPPNVVGIQLGMPLNKAMSILQAHSQSYGGKLHIEH